VVDNQFIGSRRIGLTAGSSSANFEVRFDDFSLYPAGCGLSVANVQFEIDGPDSHERPIPPGLSEEQEK
jgi:hypothetical protein